jgi:hypothetical protein
MSLGKPVSTLENEKTANSCVAAKIDRFSSRFVASFFLITAQNQLGFVKKYQEHTRFG